MFSDEEKTIAAVHRVAPAVVSITMSKTMSEARGSFLDSMLNPELLPKTHGKKSNDPLNLGLPAITPPSNEKVKVGGGSGFIVDSSGIVLTNKHVVFDEKADYVVTTADEQELPAKVVTRDPVNDIAILKVEATGLPTVTMNTRRVEPGQSVLAIGNALGLFSNTVSKGIISGLARKISAALGSGGEGGEQAPLVEELHGVIQTDVGINQGNSGGPLINLEGEVIGINTAVIFGAQNISFALPIHWAKQDLADLREHGRIVRPFIGLRYVMLTPEIQKRYKLVSDYGALVTGSHMPGNYAIVKGSPADKAGLQENDIILTINAIKLDQHNELSEVVQNCAVGDTIEMTFLRAGKERQTKTKLEERH